MKVHNCEKIPAKMADYVIHARSESDRAGDNRTDSSKSENADALSATAEFTSRRIAMFHKYSKELAELSN
jgi:hypothetical protein